MYWGRIHNGSLSLEVLKVPNKEFPLKTDSQSKAVERHFQQGPEKFLSEEMGQG